MILSNTLSKPKASRHVFQRGRSASLKKQFKNFVGSVLESTFLSGEVLILRVRFKFLKARLQQLETGLNRLCLLAERRELRPKRGGVSASSDGFVKSVD